MEKLNSFFRVIDAIAIFVGLYFCKLIDIYFESKKIPYTITFLLCIAVIIMLIKVLELLFSFLIHNSQVVRSWILREENIEGAWFDMLKIDSDYFYGILLINIRNKKIQVSGEQFDCEGNVRVSWTTVMADFDGSTLRYVYQSRYAKAGNIEEKYGFSTHDFIRYSSGKRPNSYNGYFADISYNFERQTFTGRRINDKAVLRLLADPESKKEGIMALLQNDSPPADNH